MRENKVKELLFVEFMKWMRGQTCSSYPDGETNFYDHDVKAFIKKMQTGYDRQSSAGWD